MIGLNLSTPIVMAYTIRRLIMASLLHEVKIIIGKIVLLNVNIHHATLLRCNGPIYRSACASIRLERMDGALWYQNRKSKYSQCNIGCEEAAVIYELEPILHKVV